MPKTTSGPGRRGARFKYSSVADRDVQSILRFTISEFGARQLHQYAALIDKAAGLIAADPNRPGSRGRDELGPGVRSFHVERAARRRGAAAHLLFYRIEQQHADGGAEIVILRVLHERMDPSRHVIDET